MKEENLAREEDNTGQEEKGEKVADRVVKKANKSESSNSSSSSSSRKMVCRIWTMQEELDLLKTFERFQRKKAPETKFLHRLNLDVLLPYLNKKAPHLCRKFGKQQISHKLRALKKKYEKRVVGEWSSKHNFSEDIDELYELSEKIWGQEGNDDEINPQRSSYPCLASAVEKCKTGFPYVFYEQKSWELVNPLRAEKLEKKWAKFQCHTLSHWSLLMRETMDLLRETAKLSDGKKRSRLM